jgi:hypothetical protein
VKQSANASPCIIIVHGENNLFRHINKKTDTLNITAMYDNTEPATATLSTTRSESTPILKPVLYLYGSPELIVVTNQYCKFDYYFTMYNNNAGTRIG